MTKQEFIEYTNFTDGDSFITIVIHSDTKSVDVSIRTGELTEIATLGYLAYAIAQVNKKI